MNEYDFSRKWFEFAFEKKEAKVQHTALYLWIVELNKRLGNKKEFGIPTIDTMEGLSIGNKNTYLSTLKDLEEWGFIEIVKESKNQYQACIISLCRSKIDTAQVTALGTALQQHEVQHCNSTGNGIDDSIGVSTAPIFVVEDINNIIEINNKNNITTTQQKSENPQKPDESADNMLEKSDNKSGMLYDQKSVVDVLFTKEPALMYLSRNYGIKEDFDRQRVFEAFALSLALGNKLPYKPDGICQHFSYWCPKRKESDPELFKPTIKEVSSQPQKPVKKFLGPGNFFKQQDYENYNNGAGWSGFQYPAYRGQSVQAQEFETTMNAQYGFN